MSTFVLADAAVGPVFLAVGLGAALALLLVITLMEAVVLRLIGWAAFGRSFLDALWINLVSGLSGLVVAVAIPEGWQLVGAFFMTIAVEGGMMMLFRRHPTQKTWLAVLLINVVSYAFIFAIDAL